MSFVRRKWGHLVYQAALVGLLCWLVQCNVKLGDKANWDRTTGYIIGVGSTSTKSGGSVSVSYNDPKTGEKKDADMPIPNDRVESVVNASNKDQPAYVTENIFGTRTVCLETVFDDCVTEAKPKWWMYLLLVGLLAVSVGFMIKEERERRAGGRSS